MRSQNKSKQKLTLNLLHLLYLNKLKYSPDWESWVSYLIGSENQWEIIDYPQLLNIAALITSGLTKQRASIEETKILLQQIERWVTQSNGRLIEVKESKHRTKWYPACLIDLPVAEDQRLLDIHL